MNKLQAFWRNRWVRFAIVSVLWVLIFVVWMRSPWMLVGPVVIFDIYITRFMSRYLLKYHRDMRARSKAYTTIAEWVEAVLFAVIVASLIHIFVFQMYVIPTPSMEKSLLVGDYLYVSKLSYGPKLPNTPLALPLVHNTMPLSKSYAKSYSEAVRWPYKRLAGLKPIRRDDVVVFNFPAGDTVLLENENVTYYDVEREYVAQLGPRAGRERLRRDYTITSRPVDKRANYVKRCVGLPGDTIHIVASQLYVNGLAQKEIAGMQFFYRVTTSSPISEMALDRMNIARRDPTKPGYLGGEFYHNPATGDYMMPLTAENLAKVRAMKNVLHVEKYQGDDGPQIFPNTDETGWTQDDFGPLWIPACGATVALTAANLPLYQRIIEVYEGNELRVEGDTIYINGAVATNYTFRMNYYWMMGDNRHNSADSRFWGFVPEDHIVGKASFVWLSLDREKGWFSGKVRWSKMFRKIR